MISCSVSVNHMIDLRFASKISTLTALFQRYLIYLQALMKLHEHYSTLTNYFLLHTYLLNHSLFHNHEF